MIKVTIDGGDTWETIEMPSDRVEEITPLGRRWVNFPAIEPRPGSGYWLLLGRDPLGAYRWTDEELTR